MGTGMSAQHHLGVILPENDKPEPVQASATNFQGTVHGVGSELNSMGPADETQNAGHFTKPPT